MTTKTDNSLSLFDPLVAQWFSERYGPPTQIQIQAWQAIARGEHILITAPTGSGKTLAAFLWALNQWITGQWETGRTHLVYVSPLKALNNDIRRNVRSPLAELRELFNRHQRPLPDIRVLTRSGDTPASERRGMIRRPPEILITTPESLHLMLSSRGGRSILGHVRTVLLDEIHAVLASRRGTLLISGVERLVRLSGEFQRIALSATVQPLNIAARFVGGFQQTGQSYQPRPVQVLAPGTPKRYQVAVRFPDVPEGPRSPDDFWQAFTRFIHERLAVNRSTLIFANSRRLCEKLTFLLNREQGGLLAYAHHGALSKEIRVAVEQQLKSGDLKAIFATGSLELGIDIGAVDEVVIVQAPWSVSEAVQRIGRAGHGVGRTSRGTFLSAHISDMVGAAVVARAVGEGAIEPQHPLNAPLDVLAQILVSMLAFETWHTDTLFDFIRTMAPYRQLSRRRFDLVLEMLEGRCGHSRIRELQPRISHDRIDRTLEIRKGAVLSLYATGGVIPDRGYYALRHSHTGAKIGELDEEFVWEARIGQVFTLGAQNWRIRKITAGEVRVLPEAPGKPAPPFWRAEAYQRDAHLSEMIAMFLETAESDLFSPVFEAELETAYAMDKTAAQHLIEALKEQRVHTGTPLPHRHHLLIEETALGAAQSAGSQVIVHSLWGGRINRPLAMALEAAWEEQYGSVPQIFSTNDTITFLLPPDVPAKNLLDLVSTDTVEPLLYRRLPQTGFFGARFRECAGRALLLPRGRIDQRLPLWLTRLRARKLLSAVADHPDFPILAETWRTCLQDEFDLPGLRRVLQALEAGRIARTYVRTPIPSPMARAAAWQQVNYHMYQEDQPTPRQGGQLTDDLLYEVTLAPHLRPAIDADLARQFQEKRCRLAPGYAPDSPAELLEWLKERQILPLAEWQALLAAAKRDHKLSPPALTDPIGEKVALMTPGENADTGLVVALELLPQLQAGLLSRAASSFNTTLLSGKKLESAEPPGPLPPNDRPISLAAEQLGLWLRFFGPLTPKAIGEALGIPPAGLSPLIDELTEARVVISGTLLKEDPAHTVCDRENFEILLRLARKSTAPVVETRPIHRLALFLAHYQGVTTAAGGSDDMPDRLNQLLCWAAPAGHWESDILPARLPDYRSDSLDALMQRHDLRWVGSKDKKILFCFEEELDLITDTRTDKENITMETGSEDIFPPDGGRYPFSSLEKMTGLGTASLNDRLWQWVWQGKVSNDTFAALRRGVETRFKMPKARQPLPSAGIRRPGRSMFQRWRASRPGIGSWFRLPSPESADDPLTREERNKERVRLLLDRYGILFRELLARELPMLRWAPLFRALRIMELAGEVAAGHFFDGIDGLQFMAASALPRFSRPLPNDAVFWLNALDPACLCGVQLSTLRGKLPRRLPGVHIVYHGDRPVIFSHSMGARLEIKVPPDHPRLADYFCFLDHLLTRRFMPLRSIKIKQINDTDAALQKEYIDVLGSLFETLVEPQAVTLYRPHKRTGE